MEFQFDIGAKVQVNGKTTRVGIVKNRRIVGEGEKAKIEYKIEGEKDYVSARSVVAAPADAKVTVPESIAPKIKEDVKVPEAKIEKPTAEKQPRKPRQPKKTESEMTAKDVVVQFMVDTCIAVNPKFAETYIGNHRVSMDGFKLTLPKLNYNAVVKRINKAVGQEGKQVNHHAEDDTIVGTEHNWKVKGKTITLSKDFQSGAINVAVE